MSVLYAVVSIRCVNRLPINHDTPPTLRGSLGGRHIVQSRAPVVPGQGSTGEPSASCAGTRTNRECEQQPKGVPPLPLAHVLPAGGRNASPPRASLEPPRPEAAARERLVGGPSPMPPSLPLAYPPVDQPASARPFRPPPTPTLTPRPPGLLQGPAARPAQHRSEPTQRLVAALLWCTHKPLFVASLLALHASSECQRLPRACLCFPPPHHVHLTLLDPVAVPLAHPSFCSPRPP